MIQVALERKQPLPDWYHEEPDTIPTDEFYLKAFNDLSSCRNYGMDVGPIPWRDIVAYAHYHGLDDVATDLFIRIIRGMDSFYLNWLKENREKNKA